MTAHTCTPTDGHVGHSPSPTPPVKQICHGNIQLASESGGERETAACSKQHAPPMKVWRCPSRLSHAVNVRHRELSSVY